MIFFGEAQHTLDEKGRIRIPSIYKKDLGVNPYFTYGDGCILVYTNERANKFKEEMNLIFNDDAEFYDEEKSEKYSDLMKGQFCQEDSQGRILLPPALVEDAGLTKNLVMTTGGNHLQIWDEDKLKEKRAAKRLAKLEIKKI